MHRTISYDEELAKRLQDPEYAKGYLLALMEDIDDMKAFSLHDALKHSIEAMGIKEFSEKSGIPSSNICRMLKSEDLPKIETLNKYLAPFGLKVKLDVEEAS